MTGLHRDDDYDCVANSYVESFVAVGRMPVVPEAIAARAKGNGAYGHARLLKSFFELEKLCK